MGGGTGGVTALVLAALGIGTALVVAATLGGARPAVVLAGLPRGRVMPTFFYLPV